MKTFLKENWFKFIVIVFLLIISIELPSMITEIHTDAVGIDRDIPTMGNIQSTLDDMKSDLDSIKSSVQPVYR